MNTFQIYEKVSQMLWMKIEEASTKLDCEHVTKGLIHLAQFLNEWHSFSDFFPGCSILTCVTGVFVTPAVEDISSQQ